MSGGAERFRMRAAGAESASRRAPYSAPVRRPTRRRKSFTWPARSMGRGPIPLLRSAPPPIASSPGQGCRRTRAPAPAVRRSHRWPMSAPGCALPRSPLAAAIDESLHLSAEQRPQSVAAWRTALQGAVEEEPQDALGGSFPGLPAGDPAGGSRSRSKLPLLIGVVVIAAAAGGYFLMRSPGSSGEQAASSQPAPARSATAVHVRRDDGACPRRMRRPLRLPSRRRMTPGSIAWRSI